MALGRMTSEHHPNWPGGAFKQKFRFLAFVLVLGFAVLAVPGFENLDEDDAVDNNQAVLYVDEGVPRAAQKRPESARSTLFCLAAPRFSLFLALMPPTRAGQDLLHLLTLQKK
jgi:hypothetical protein